MAADKGQRHSVARFIVMISIVGIAIIGNGALLVWLAGTSDAGLVRSASAASTATTKPPVTTTTTPGGAPGDDTGSTADLGGAVGNLSGGTGGQQGLPFTGVAAVGPASASSGPPAATPETPQVLALAGLAAALIGCSVYLRRRRAVHTRP